MAGFSGKHTTSDDMESFSHGFDYMAI
jgi:hypothetical protein